MTKQMKRLFFLISLLFAGLNLYAAHLTQSIDKNKSVVITKAVPVLVKNGVVSPDMPAVIQDLIDAGEVSGVMITYSNAAYPNQSGNCTLNLVVPNKYIKNVRSALKSNSIDSGADTIAAMGEAK